MKHVMSLFGIAISIASEMRADHAAMLFEHLIARMINGAKNHLKR